MVERTRTRCAVYTRKSSEEGLDQDFNSLDAQREACEAYVLSQKHEGWTVLADRYDDGGFSGGNLERPGLVRLLADVRARRIDVIVVYKVDRLTRSLADFAKIVEVLDAQGISFVAVTQQFNTTTSMGRLTLNVLLSFAQFEREIAGERIRDKIKASRQKGMWMGGSVPLGYEVKDRALIINDAEADKVRLIYDQYLALGSVRALAEHLNAEKIRSHHRLTQSGRWIGGHNITRGSLYGMLRNPIYIGRILHKGATYPGLHEPIIDQQIWDSVQSRLKQNSVEQSRQSRSRHPSLLAGLVFDGRGKRLTPTHTNKSGIRYRYYVSQALVNGTCEIKKISKRWRIPAQELETTIASELRSFLGDHCQLTSVLNLTNLTPDELGLALTAASKISTTENAVELRAMLRRFVTRIVVEETTIAISLDVAELSLALGLPPPEPDDRPSHTIIAGLRVAKRGVEQRLILERSTAAGQRDPTLVKAIARAYTWFEDIKHAHVCNLSDLARRERLPRSYVQAHLSLAFLSPRIVKTILEGRQPPDLSLKRLMTRMDLAADWTRQWRQLGFSD